MQPAFIVNPAATKDQLEHAMEARVGQASGICEAMSASANGEDSGAIEKTFWAVEHLIDEIFELHRAIVGRSRKQEADSST